MKRKKMRFRIEAAILLLLMCLWDGVRLQAFAAEDLETDFVSLIYDEQDGAYSSNIYDILQTKDGTIYIASSVGLVSFDGRQFKREYNSITSEAKVLFQDTLEQIWIGTNDTGVIVVSDDNVTVFDKKNGLDSNCIQAIVPDNRIGIYVATTGGLYYFDRRMNMERIQDEVCTYTVGIACNSSGIVAGVNNSGAIYFIENGEVKSGFEKSISDEVCTNVSLINEKFVFSTYGGELITVDYADGKIHKVSQNVPKLNGVNRLYNEEEKVWILADNGIGYLEGEKYTPVYFNDFNGYYQDMFRDYEGNYWIASSRYGLMLLAKNEFKYVSSAGDENVSAVNAIKVNQGLIYVGKDNGLDIWNANTYEKVENELTTLLTGVKINGIADDGYGSLWIATYGDRTGLVRYKGGEIQVYGQLNGMPSDSIEFVKKVSEGCVVVVAKNDILFIKNGVIDKKYSKDTSLCSSNILDIVLNEKQELMFATEGEGVIVWKDGSVVRRFSMNEGLSSEVVRRIIPYSDGYILVTGNALCYMHGEEIKRLGFAYSGMYDVVCGTGESLWVLSNSGVFKVNGKELIGGGEVTYKLYNYEQGFQNSLTSNSWSDVDEKGNMYLCCQDGMVVMSLLEQRETSIDYKIGIKGVYYNGEKVKNQSGIELPSTKETLMIRPAFTKFGYEELQISYYLEGYDTNVTLVDSSDLPNEIVYANLPGGEYVFRMELLRNDGREMVDSVQININKKIAWYENTAIRSMLVAVLVLVLFLVGHIFIRLQLTKAEKKKNAYRNLTKQTIMAIAKTIDAKDEYTNGHSVRVANYSREIAKRYGMKEQQQEDIYYCGLLHDIGKIGIPDEILNKTGRLTDEEFEIIKSHPAKGAEILKDVTMIPHLVEGAKYHHEKFDGSGYNEGLIGKQIPLFARIIAVADTFDAMTSSRCYRTGLELDYVKEELKRVSGKQLDPVFVNILLEMINDGTVMLEGMMA